MLRLSDTPLNRRSIVIAPYPTYKFNMSSWNIGYDPAQTPVEMTYNEMKSGCRGGVARA